MLDIWGVVLIRHHVAEASEYELDAFRGFLFPINARQTRDTALAKANRFNLEIAAEKAAGEHIDGDIVYAAVPLPATIA